MTQATREKLICFIQRQVSQIDDGGLPVLLRKVRVFVLIMLAAPAVLFVRALQPFLVIRFGPLRSERIGHLASDPELYLCEREAGVHNSRTFDIFYHNSPISNQQLKKMWDRTLCVFPFSKWMDRFNRWLPGGRKHVIPMPAARDVHGLLMHTQAHLSFTPEEESRGRQALQELGISEDAPFICFSARDSAFLEALLPDWDLRYHDYRNVNIQNYLPAVEELAHRGYYMFRMGALVKETLKSANPRIIDYAKNYRSDFLDIFLSAKCRFYFGDSSGISEVSRIFRRPVIYTNYINFAIKGLLCCGPGSLFIPKKLWLKKERRFLTFRQVLDAGVDKFGRSEQYEQFGLEVLENTPDEITAVALEMDDRLKGKWQTSEGDEERQRRFWSLFNPNSLHGKVVTRIGTEFLRQNRELLD